MDPILMIDELRSAHREDFAGGFPPHPHRGMQTLTYLRQGGLIHEDSRGNRGEIRGGGVQWMSAGRGIIHSEMPTLDSNGLHGFQLWINLPRAEKMSEPRYRDIPGPELVRYATSGVAATAIAGRWSIDDVVLQGPLVELDGRAAIAELVLAPGVSSTLELPDSENALAYVYDGSVAHGGSQLSACHLLITSRGTHWTLEAGESGAGLLLMRGQPLREPVANYGPFVMNTEAEIEQAVRDYNAGKFDQIEVRESSING
jgi:redox-sensitive bicupin YhaK (pirin superfamily)